MLLGNGMEEKLKVIVIGDYSALGITTLTFLKTYEVLNYDREFDWYHIENDNGDIWRYNTKMFLTIEEFRDKQITKVLT